MMFDVAAGVVIAAFVVGAVMYGGRQMENGRPRDRGALIGGMLVAAFLVIWRASCWYFGLGCDVPERLKAEIAAECPAPGSPGYFECMAPKYGISPTASQAVK